MNKLILTTLVGLYLLVFAKPVVAQDYLVDFTYLGSRTKAELYLIFFQVVDYDVDLYKIRYKTNDVNNLPDTASGLLVLPKVPANTMLPFVIYNHGTTTGPEDVPSRLQGGYQVAMAYASFGFATVAPDYLGLGDSRGFHPYLHAATEATASFDMVFAGHEYLDHNDPDLNANFLFVAGYSQGGHASMAFHKYVDDFWTFVIPVTAATHMSGPYSISGVMRERILSDESYTNPAYIAYIFLGYNEAYHLYDSIGQVFAEPYATSIEAFYNENINLTTLNAQLISALSTHGDTVPKKMLQDSILNALTNDLNHPLNVALQDNDIYNWAPSSPTRLYYCGSDEQVPPRNSIIADSVMNELGAPDVQAINLGSSFNHSLCVIPAITNSIDFFKSFLNPSSTSDQDSKSELLKVHPNPTFDFVSIDWEAASSGCEYQIINMNGQTVRRGQISSNMIPVSNLQGGIYTITCSAGGETRMARMIRQ